MKLRTSLSFKTACMALAAFSLLSCECRRSANGQILDESTLLPLDSVNVKGLSVLFNEDVSDSAGNYILGSTMTGTVGGCPDLKVTYSKEGYETLTMTNPDDEIIYMKKK